MTGQFSKVTPFALYQINMGKQILTIHFLGKIAQAV